MRQCNPPLDRAILAAFASALETGRLDAAEHLLCALECLGNEEGESGAAEIQQFDADEFPVGIGGMIDCVLYFL